MINAQLPDGTTLQFPDGTPDAVVDGTVKQHVQSLPGGQVETPESKMGFSPAPPEERAAPQAAGPFDEYGRPMPSTEGAGRGITLPSISGWHLDAPTSGIDPTAPPAPGALGRIGTAAAEGWRGSPAIPAVPADAGPGLRMFNPFVTAANTLLGGAGAAFRGGQQFVQESLDPMSPGLGREVAGIPEAFPLGMHNNGLMIPPEPARPYAQPSMADRLENAIVRADDQPPRPAATAAPAPAPTPASGAAPTTPPGVWVPIEPGMRYPGQQTRINPDTGRGEVLDPTRGAPATPPPPPEPAPAETPPPVAPPQPASVGAAASRENTPASDLGLTPKEEIAYRSTAEGNKLLEPQEPGVRDDQQYLRGERISEAEASQDVGVARELKSLRQQTPELDAKMTADEAHNNNIRTNAINNALPGQVQINAAKTARQDAMQAAEPRVFANAGDADVQPIVDHIQDVLNDPKNRQNTQLQQYVQPLIDRLQNADGTPKITDPRELWGFRQDVQHLTSGAAQRSDPNLARVSGVLGGVLDTVDNQIEAAASGYKAQLRDDYRARSQQIDAMEALNAERFKLFDSQNKPNYNSVQGLMRRITDARQTGDPYEPFTHVPQETLDQLWKIRDSMRRTQAADRLAAPKGSPTTQNLGDAMRAAGRMAAQHAAPVVGATLGSALIPIPGVGPAVGLLAGHTVNHLLSERAMAQRYARGMQLLTPANQLAPPP
jgi:hypothetical protein